MEIATQDWFEGHWTMRRAIRDRAGRETASFRGRAVLVADGAGLTCAETGVLHCGGQQCRSGRVLLYRFPAPGRVAVLFANGRPFHEISTADGKGVHFCTPDTYRVAYRFGPDAWETRWQVSGPAKDYVMDTRYERC